MFLRASMFLATLLLFSGAWAQVPTGEAVPDEIPWQLLVKKFPQLAEEAPPFLGKKFGLAAAIALELAFPAKLNEAEVLPHRKGLAKAGALTIEDLIQFHRTGQDATAVQRKQLDPWAMFSLLQNNTPKEEKTKDEPPKKREREISVELLKKIQLDLATIHASTRIVQGAAEARAHLQHLANMLDPTMPAISDFERELQLFLTQIDRAVLMYYRFADLQDWNGVHWTALQLARQVRFIDSLTRSMITSLSLLREGDRALAAPVLDSIERSLVDLGSAAENLWKWKWDDRLFNPRNVFLSAKGAVIANGMIPNDLIRTLDQYADERAAEGRDYIALRYAIERFLLLLNKGDWWLCQKLTKANIRSRDGFFEVSFYLEDGFKFFRAAVIAEYKRAWELNRQGIHSPESNFFHYIESEGITMTPPYPYNWREFVIKVPFQITSPNASP